MGLNDSWINLQKDLLFLSKEQVLNLFYNFEILSFNEIEKNGTTGLGKNKHWHVYEIIAKKIK